MKFKVGSIVEHTRWGDKYQVVDRVSENYIVMKYPILNDSKYALTNESYYRDITLQEKRNKILEQLLNNGNKT